MAVEARRLRRRRDAGRRDAGCGSALPTPPACRAFTLMGVLGGLAARGEHHDRVWELLGVEHPASTWEQRRVLSRRAAVPGARCARGGSWSAPSGTRPRRRGLTSRPHVDVVGSSERWGVAKPAPGVLRAAGREAACAGLRRSPTWATASTTTSCRRSPPAWSPCTSAAGRGGSCTSRRPRRDRDPLARRAAGGARVSLRVGIGVDAHALERRRAARARRGRARPSARARRPLRRRRARARADRRAARRGGARRHRLALPVGRRALPRRRQPRPAARGVPAGARGGLAARQRRLRARRRGAADRAVPRRDAPAAVGGARRRRGERARDDDRPARLHRPRRGPRRARRRPARAADGRSSATPTGPTCASSATRR